MVISSTIANARRIGPPAEKRNTSLSPGKCTDGCGSNDGSPVQATVQGTFTPIVQVLMAIFQPHV
jgi:hypothetical protein